KSSVRCGDDPHRVGVAEHTAAAEVGNAALEHREHHPSTRSDAGRERREAKLPRLLKLREALIATTGGAIDGDQFPDGAEFASRHLGCDAVATGVGGHLEGLAQSACLVASVAMAEELAFL